MGVHKNWLIANGLYRNKSNIENKMVRNDYELCVDLRSGDNWMCQSNKCNRDSRTRLYYKSQRVFRSLRADK